MIYAYENITMKYIPLYANPKNIIKVKGYLKKVDAKKSRDKAKTVIYKTSHCFIKFHFNDNQYLKMVRFKFSSVYYLY